MAAAKNNTFPMIPIKTKKLQVFFGILAKEKNAEPTFSRWHLGYYQIIQKRGKNWTKVQLNE